MSHSASDCFSITKTLNSVLVAGSYTYPEHTPSIPVDPLDRLGGGTVALCHHARKGGQRDTFRSFGCEHHR
jgi:hypothetical protein